MEIYYQRYNVELLFDESIVANIKTVSVLRSILGSNLKSMCCIAKNKNCADCLYSDACVYATLFESIIPKDNPVLAGRNTAPPPYMLSLGSNSPATKNLLFDLTLFGRHTEYFPYIYGSFQRAGKRGFGKHRIPFSIKDAAVNGQSVVDSGEKIKTNLSPALWKAADDGAEKSGEILIKLKTPLRYKAGNSLANKIEAGEFMNCLYRRASVLCGFYGNFSEKIAKKYTGNCQFFVGESAIVWRENPRYSARQKADMSLGGMTGEFTLKGKFRQQDLNLIEFARLFGAGKNTNFGLGQIDFFARFE